MSPGERRTTLVILAVSAAALIWSGAAQRPYWMFLSLAAMFWSVLSLRRGSSTNPAVMGGCAAALAVVPLLWLAAGPPVAEPLEVLLSPVVLFTLSLWIVSSSEPLSERCGTGTLAFFTFLLSVSMGTLALLSLYYLDAIIFTHFMPANSTLMWPLSSLLIGSLIISSTLRVTGWEEAALGFREANG